MGIAALTVTGLQTLVIDETALALRALTGHRDDLVKTRTQTVNRLHRLLIQLVPAGGPQRLSRADHSRVAQHRRPPKPLCSGPRMRWPAT